LKEKDQILKTSKELLRVLKKEKVKRSEKAASPGEASSRPSLKEKDQILKTSKDTAPPGFEKGKSKKGLRRRLLRARCRRGLR
jgi:hypothetical protein